ncbi:MAG: hypothetical protein ACLSF4_03105 [Hominenteromicrobium sp.]|uniref:hypothetical protein n=1 Tax=Hominenteromicrobium sp. TaxID=3073581 RepID=UPI003993A5CF
MNINFRTPMKSDSYNYMQLINLYIDMWRDDPKRVDYHSRAERYAKALANSIVHTKGFDGGGQNSYFYDSSGRLDHLHNPACCAILQAGRTSYRFRI